MTLPTPILEQSASTFATTYLGQPGAMTKTPVPDTGITITLGRGGTTHGLASGGTSINRARYVRRNYTLSFNHRLTEDMDPLLAYYYGTMGAGPFALMIPGWRNVQDMDVSTMGAAVGGVTGWATTAGDTQPVSDFIVAPPLPNTDVLKWASAVNTHNLVEGSFSGTNYLPNTSGRPYSTPYLADQAFLVSIYARTTSGTPSVAALAIGQTAAGGAMVAAIGATTVLSASVWTRMSVAVPVGTGGWSAAATPYISAGLRCLSAGSPTIYVAASQIEVGVSALRNWVTGMGSPRVVIPDPLGASHTLFARRAQSLTLMEQ